MGLGFLHAASVIDPTCIRFSMGHPNMVVIPGLDSCSLGASTFFNSEIPRRFFAWKDSSTTVVFLSGCLHHGGSGLARLICWLSDLLEDGMSSIGRKIGSLADIRRRHHS